MYIKSVVNSEINLIIVQYSFILFSVCKDTRKFTETFD